MPERYNEQYFKWFMETSYIKLSNWSWIMKATGTYSVILLAKFAVLLVSYQDISWRSTACRNIHRTRPICEVIVFTNYFTAIHRHHISHWYFKQDVSSCNKAPPFFLLPPTKKHSSYWLTSSKENIGIF